MIGRLRLAIPWVCVLAIACLAPGCRSRMRYGTSRPLTQNTVAWRTVSSSDGSATVLMPVRPVENTTTSQEEDGARRTATLLHGETSFGYFGLFVVRFEGGIVGNPLAGVGDVAAEVFRRVEIERRRSRRLSVDGFYAREDVGADAEGAFVALRQFVGDDRVVVAMVAVPRTPDMLRIAERYMESIQLDPSHALFPTAGSRHSDGTWTPVYLPEADFGVELPSAPALREQTVELAGQRAGVQTFESRDAWGIYRVRVVGFGGDSPPSGAYEALRRMIHADRDIRPVHANGFPGRVYTRDDGANRHWIRMYQTVGRLYVVEAIGARASIRDRRVGQRLLSFFQSFRIL